MTSSPPAAEPADASTTSEPTSPSAAPASLPSTPGSPSGQPGAWDRWRPLLLRWHFYAGLLVGPFLLVAAVSGVLYALIPQIDAAVHRHELVVDNPGTPPLPLSEQVARARAAQPDGTITGITPPSTATDTTRVVVAVDGLPDSYVQTVFIDPYTGEVRGNLTTLGEWLPTRAWFDELHRNLHLGALGRHYSELAASWLWFVSLGGLVLWIGYRRRTRKLRRLLVADRTAPRRQRRLTLHGAIGVWVIAGLLALSVSGLTWSRYAGANVAELRNALSWTTPGVSTDIDGNTAPAVADEHAGHGGHAGGATTGAPAGETDVALIASIDGVYRTAQQSGLRSPMVLTPPADAESAWTAGENKRSAPTHYDTIAVDPATYQVIDRVNLADWPFMAKMTDWIIGAHMGILFGIVNQILLAALGIGLIVVIVLGYVMWWRRRPPSSDRKMATAPRRGALGLLKPAEAVAVVVGVALLGWWIPLFGIPLAVFIAIDAVIGQIRERGAVGGSAS